MGRIIEHPDFALPNRKELLKSDMEYEVLVIDSTETPIERPKKSNEFR
ncbi:hypothetical protein [Candidatus Mesenet endosymbiont of Phosphuga atrata]